MECSARDRLAAPAPEYWNKGGMGSFRGAHGERMEREPTTGVWEQSPQRGPEAEPLVNQSISLIADLRPGGRIANEMQVK